MKEMGGEVSFFCLFGFFSSPHFYAFFPQLQFLGMAFSKTTELCLEPVNFILFFSFVGREREREREREKRLRSVRFLSPCFLPFPNIFFLSFSRMIFRFFIELRKKIEFTEKIEVETL